MRISTLFCLLLIAALGCSSRRPPSAAGKSANGANTTPQFVAGFRGAAAQASFIGTTLGIDSPSSTRSSAHSTYTTVLSRVGTDQSQTAMNLVGLLDLAASGCTVAVSNDCGMAISARKIFSAVDCSGPLTGLTAPIETAIAQNLLMRALGRTPTQSELSTLVSGFQNIVAALQSSSANISLPVVQEALRDVCTVALTSAASGATIYPN